MKINTNELTGAALDWAVAKCEGATDLEFDGVTWGFKLGGKLRVLARGWAESTTFLPSSNWAQAGPIIEREKVSIECKHDGWWVASYQYNYSDEKEYLQLGETPLTAAMRCYCCAKLGDEIDIPDGLV